MIFVSLGISRWNGAPTRLLEPGVQQRPAIPLPGLIKTDSIKSRTARL